MGFWGLLVVALMPVLKTLIITALGLFLALHRVNLLGPSSRHHLNHLVFYVFGPALVGGYLANTITLNTLLALWFMPVNILLTFMIGSAFAWILNRVAATPPHLRGLVIGCCSAGNLGNLILIILPEVCKESTSPFGDPSACSRNAMAYTSLSMSVGSIYIWCYVYPIMHACANKFKGVEEMATSTNGDVEEPPHPCPSLPHENNKVKRMQWLITVITSKINLKMVFAPSTIAAIIGFIIGTTPIRKVMIGDKAPLRVIESSVSMLGGAAVPAMTLIVGANLLNGLKKAGVRVALIVGIIVVRYIALPVIGVVIVKAAHHHGMVGPDLLYQFVLMLQYALPPALTVGMITELFGAGQSECSVIMLWTYSIASVSLTLWSTFFMWIVDKYT